MKRKNNITLSTKICAVILLSSMVLSACADTQTAQKQKIPAATYMGGDNTSAEVCKALKDAGASHVDIFQTGWLILLIPLGKMQNWKTTGQIHRN